MAYGGITRVPVALLTVTAIEGLNDSRDNVLKKLYLTYLTLAFLLKHKIRAEVRVRWPFL